MSNDINFWDAVRRIRAGDARFQPELYTFVMEALEYTMNRLSERRHVSGVELLDGMCRYARDRFGLLAHTVLEKWGARSASDIGVVVFQLVDAGVLAKQPTDRLEDFDIPFDLREALERDYFGESNE